MSQTQTITHGRVVGTLSCQKDSYQRTYDARVISCIPAPQQNGSATSANSKDKKSNIPAAKPSWLIEFDDSVLFPEGGGQPTDHGRLVPLDGKDDESIYIDFVERQGLRCVVHSPKPLEVGSSIRQEVDFDRRWDLMQQHTGQHLLSAVMDTYANLKTLGWGMGSGNEMSYVDLPCKPTEAELQSIQTRCNELIQQNLNITVEVPDDAKTEKLPDDYDSERGVVRVIKIGDLDNNTCCGTHLQQTSHIGLLLLGPNQPNSSGRIRQFFSAGSRALHLASTSTQTVRTISRLLSTGSSAADLTTALTRLQTSYAASRSRESKLLSDVAGYEIERVKRLLREGRSAFVHRPEPGMEFVNVVVAGVRADVAEKNVVVLASGEGKIGGAVVVCGKTKEDVDVFVAKVQERLGTVKGGGKGERWQGKVAEWKGGDLDALKRLCEEEE